MLKIKLTRLGKKNQPFYRIVVAERRSKRDGQYVAKLGDYNPLTDPATINLDVKAYEEWLTKGAQPTETVLSLYNKVTGKPPVPRPQKPKKEDKPTESEEKYRSL